MLYGAGAEQPSKRRSKFMDKKTRKKHNNAHGIRV